MTPDDLCPVCFAPWSVHRVTDPCVVDVTAPEEPQPEAPSRPFVHALAVASGAEDGIAQSLANLIAHALP
jgi:hypothetical protein